MKSLKRTEERAVGFLVGACYLVSVTLCGAAAYAFVQSALAATGAAAHEVYTPAGLF